MSNRSAGTVHSGCQLIWNHYLGPRTKVVRGYATPANRLPTLTTCAAGPGNTISSGSSALSFNSPPGVAGTQHQAFGPCHGNDRASTNFTDSTTAHALTAVRASTSHDVPTPTYAVFTSSTPVTHGSAPSFTPCRPHAGSCYASQPVSVKYEAHANFDSMSLFMPMIHHSNTASLGMDARSGHGCAVNAIKCLRRAGKM